MRRLSMKTLRALAVLACALCGTAAQALCTVGASGLMFGSLDGLAGPTAGRTTTGTISVNCLAMAGTTTYRIGIGASSSGGTGGRSMANVLGGGANLAYDLYLDPGYTLPWRDTTGAQATGTLKPNVLSAASATHTIYGKLATQQGAIQPGLFQDSLTVTITYDP